LFNPASTTSRNIIKDVHRFRGTVTIWQTGWRQIQRTAANAHLGCDSYKSHALRFTLHAKIFDGCDQIYFMLERVCSTMQCS
jgi:hypothetical protein